jgi:hypothetical protein
LLVTAVQEITVSTKQAVEFSVMEKIFRRVVDSNFSDLQGLSVDASIPVSEQLINELISAAIRENDNIRDCKVSIGQQNKISVKLNTPLWPWPLEVKLRLDRAVDFRGSPRMTAWLENKVLLARIGSFLKVLPPGIDLYDDRLVIDIGSFLSTPEPKRILRLIQSLEIKTDMGKMIFDVKIK